MTGLRGFAIGASLLGACAATAHPPQRPDAAALARETRVRARSAELVLSDHWRARAKLSGIAVTHPGPAVDLARGEARFELEGLRVEAVESIRVKWLADHENLLLYAREVALFAQQRDQPYHSTDLSAVAMANDQVSFFKQ